MGPSGPRPLRGAELEVRIGRARPDEVDGLPELELEAARRFEGLIPAELLSDATTHEEFRSAQASGLLWVARLPDGSVAGFALVELLGRRPHLEEIDVLPAWGRRGIGRALVEAVCTWARRAGHRSLTLTTYRDIPWNAPFYEELGFRTLGPDELPPELAESLRQEATRGFDAGRRVVMRRDLVA